MFVLVDELWMVLERKFLLLGVCFLLVGFSGVIWILEKLCC